MKEKKYDSLHLVVPKCSYHFLFAKYRPLFLLKTFLLVFTISPSKGDTWVHKLKICIEECECTLYFFDIGLSGYDNFEPSRKLRILNFLFHLSLGTN